MLITGKQRAALAALSALKLPGMFMWLGIQQNLIVLPALIRFV